MFGDNPTGLTWNGKQIPILRDKTFWRREAVLTSEKEMKSGTLWGFFGVSSGYVCVYILLGPP